MTVRFPNINTMEYRNEYDCGFNVMVSYDSGMPSSIQFDIEYVLDGLTTDDVVGVLMSKEAAYELIAMLFEAIRDLEFQYEGLTEMDFKTANDFYKNNAIED